MATGHEAEVIRYLRRKSSSGFESPTYSGLYPILLQNHL